MLWASFNFYRDWGYNLGYPQLFRLHKRPSDEGQRVVVAWGRDKSVFWLQVLNDHWLGDGRTWLTGEAITVADYFVGGLVALGDIIRWDFARTPNVEALAGTGEGAAELEGGQRGARRVRGVAEGAGVRQRLSGAAALPGRDRAELGLEVVHEGRDLGLVDLGARHHGLEPDRAQRVVRQDVHEAAAGERLARQELRQHGDAEAFERRRQERPAVVGGETRADLGGDRALRRSRTTR